MDDLLNPLFSVPLFIVMAEMLASIYLSRRQTKNRLAWIIGTYLFFVALAAFLGLISHDEFGFSWIPLLVITDPWTIVLKKLGVHLSFLPSNSWIETFLGTAFNCLLFYILGKVSYPKHSARLSGQHAT